MESRHSVQSTSVSYGGIGEIQKDVPNSRKDCASLELPDIMLWSICLEDVLREERTDL